MMDVQAALKERMELFQNVYAFKHNKRVPLLGNFFTWKYLDCGYNLNQLLYDYDLIEKAETEFHERYQYDAYNDFGSRNPMLVTDAVGGGHHKINADGDIVDIQDHYILLREEYGEYSADPTAYYWSKVLKRVCKPGITLGELKNAMKEFVTFNSFIDKMINKFINEFGVLLQSNAMAQYITPMETLVRGLRGMKELAIDIRRCKPALKEYLDAEYRNATAPSLERILALGETKTGYIGDVVTAMLGHSLLSAKQFEELYWPYLKPAIDACIKNKRHMFMFCESTMLRFVEFFQDIPKDVLLIHLEEDDIFEIRKRLPNIALVGGMSTDLLGNGTKQQCIDYAKKLIDTLGEGYVLSQDKMMSYRNDAKRENLLAVNEFVRGYQY